MSQIKNEKFNEFCNINKKFHYSNLYIIIILAISALGFIFRLEKYAMILLILLTSYNLIVNCDMMPNFLLLVMIAMIPLARYAEVGYFLPLKYLVPIPVMAFIIHFILYPSKPQSLTYLMPTIAVAVSITLGGLFSSYYIDNFTMPALYYIITLGIGMVGIYLLFEAYIPVNNKETIIYFSKIMVALGIMGIIMIITNYFRFGYLIKDDIRSLLSKFQFGNNLSTNLLLSMPFAFYLAIKSKYSVFYFIIGCLEYMAVVFSLSRGGIIFGTLMIPLIIIATIIFANKKQRIKLFTTLIIIIGIVTFIILLFSKELGDYVVSQVHISGSEARVNLYKLAWENFLKYPIFGTGLGFMYDDFYHPKAWCIYWYHSTLFQILGSLGILGVICYGYQYFVRFKNLYKKRTIFNAFVLLSFLGFEGYSMVNVGNFAPLPYVVMVIVMFIVVDRYNNCVSCDEKLFNDEKIQFLYKNKIMK